MIGDLRRIVALRHVAERGTVTAAAEALGYTPSAVSQQISALETELGVAVLERRGRNVVLTDAGRVLLDHAEPAIESLERAHSALAELQGEPTGTVTIGALASATASIVPDALRTLAEQHPRLRPEVFVHPLDQNVEELRLGALDIAVDQFYEFAPHSLFDAFDRTPLLTEPLVLLSPASRPVTSVGDARDLDWVVSPPTSACGESVRTVTARHGYAPRCRFQSEDHFATMRLVAAGLAVAVVPSLALLHRTPDVHVSVVPGAHRTICALTRPATGARPAVAAVIEHLERAAERFQFEALAA